VAIGFDPVAEPLVGEVDERQQPVRLDEVPVNLIYMAEASCRSCSADLQSISRLVPRGVRVLMLPEIADQDAALRQVVDLYRYQWPLLLGRDLPRHLGMEARQVLLVARGGWSAAAMRPQSGPSVTPLCETTT